MMYTASAKYIYLYKYKEEFPRYRSSVFLQLTGGRLWQRQQESVFAVTDFREHLF